MEGKKKSESECKGGKKEMKEDVRMKMKGEGATEEGKWWRLVC